MNETDLRGIFEEVVVNDIERKQVGLTRFINQMRFQITKAEEHWATLYYDYLQSKWTLDFSYYLLLQVKKLN